jgi:p-cumate 2,3-dioxygenase alpha subunit
VCFDRGVEPLADYLAGAREVLDLIADQSLDGSMRIVKGEQRYSIRANWKLLAENSVDGYHAVPVHKSYLAYLQGTGALLPGSAVVTGRAKALGNGHAVIEYRAPWGRPVAHWAPTFGESARGEIEAIRAELRERHGAERAERIADWNRNMIIFPNLVVNDIMAVTIRTFSPVRAGEMDVTAWEIAPAEESGERLARRLHSFLEFLGPGGFATPDDVEMLERCQQGLARETGPWIDFSRGLDSDRRGENGSISGAASEMPMRVQFEAWVDCMTREAA